MPFDLFKKVESLFKGLMRPLNRLVATTEIALSDVE